MGETPDLVRVFLTITPLEAGNVIEVLAEIDGDIAIYGPNHYRARGEGLNWHRTRWAAENCARQLQMARLAELRSQPVRPAVRAEIARIEAMRFGRPGS